MDLTENLKIKNKSNSKKFISDIIGVALSIIVFVLMFLYRNLYNINNFFMDILLIVNFLVSLVLIIITIIDIIRLIKQRYEFLLTYDKLFINSKIGEIFLRWEDIEHIDNFELKKTTKFSKRKIDEYIGIRLKNYDNFIIDTLLTHPKLYRRKAFFIRFKIKAYRNVLAKKSMKKLWKRLKETNEPLKAIKKIGKLGNFILEMISNRDKCSFDLIFDKERISKPIYDFVILLNKYRISYEDGIESQNTNAKHSNFNSKYYEYEYVKKPDKKSELSEIYIKRCYRKLRIPYNSDLQTVKKAYRRLLKLYHPDLWYDDKEKKEKYKVKLLEINRAYQDLVRYLN